MIADRHLSFRVRQDQLDQINALAAEHHMSRSQYIVRMTTGEMPAQQSQATRRIEDLEQRLALLEERANAAAW